MIHSLSLHYTELKHIQVNFRWFRDWTHYAEIQMSTR